MKRTLLVLGIILGYMTNLFAYSISSSSGTSVCYGSQTTLTFVGYTSSQITWYSAVPDINNQCTGAIYLGAGNTLVVTVTGTVTIYAKPSCGTSNTASVISITLTVGQYSNGKPVITGPTNLCLNPSNSTYSASNSGGSSNEWALSPANAGVITNNNGTCSIAWTSGFTGVASLNCRHNQTICGYSLWSDTLKIMINPLPVTPSITVSGATTICNGNTVPLSAPVGYSYLWSSGETTESIAAALVGNYTVTVVDNNGCKSASSSPVTIDSIPVTPSITTGGATTICQGNTVSLSAPNGFTYQWSTGATSQSISANLAGNYTVKITDANNCTSINSLPVTVTVNSLPAIPAISASGSTAICQGSNVTLSAPTGYTYKWSTGAISQSISVNTVGNYTVQVIETNGCISVSSSPASVTINSLPATPSISIGGATTFCQGYSVILSAPLSTSYKWSNGTISQNATISSTGNYTLQVIDINGCTSANSQPVSVTVNSLPATPAISVSGSTSICQGSSVSLSAPTGYTYLWSNGATAQGIAVSIAGNYTVQVTDGNNCTSANSLPKSVIVNSLPATPNITVIGGSTTFCQGNYVILSAPTGYTYLWSNNATGRNITADKAINYSVQVIDGNGCKSASSTPVAITINNLPAKPTITVGGATSFCKGDSVTLSAPTSASYLWTSGTWGSNSQNATITITSSGTYSLKVIDNNGCISDSSYIVITVKSLPSIPAITSSGSTAICQGSSVSLSAPVGYTYLWSNGLTTQSIGASIAGNYTVKITDANNCTSANSLPVIVSVNNLPATPSITYSGLTTICQGSSVSLSAPTSSSYLWSNGATTKNIVVSKAGNYTVKVTDMNGCISANSSQVTVVVDSIPNKPTITVGGSTTICQGNTVTLSAPTNFGYLWSNGATSQSITVSSAGIFDVRVKNSNGCSSDTSTAITVTVNNIPSNAGTITGLSTVLQGQKAVTYTVPLISNATSYIWTIPTGTKGNSSTNSITIDFDSTAVSSNISVKGTSSCGDGINSTLAITVNPIPYSAGVISGVTSVVQGQTSITYTVPIITNATSYIWTLPNGFIGSSSTNNITVDISNSAQSGNITVKGHSSNSDGKISSLPISVEIPIITPSVNSILVSATPSSSSTINIISNTTWITSSNQSWLTVSQSTSSGNGSITISATNNPTNVIRTAIITIQTANGSQIITVTQGAGTGTAVEVVNTDNISIFPNPTKTSFSINNEGLAQIDVYSLGGALVLSTKVSGKESVSISRLSAGTYIVKITTSKGVSSQNLVVE